MKQNPSVPCLLSICFGVGSLVITGCASSRIASNHNQPQTQKPPTPVKVELNMEPMGMTDDLSVLRKKLEEVFKNRKENHAYKIGMERSDLPMDERIEKTVFIKAEASITLDEFQRTFEAIEDARATPVLLPITVAERVARKIEAHPVRICTVCAVAEKSMKEGEARPHFFTLQVSLSQPSSQPPDSHRALDDFIISDGVPLTISSSSNSRSGVLVTVAKHGEYAIGDVRVGKAELGKALLNQLSTKPTAEKNVFIKADPKSTYDDLENIYYAAFAADSRGVYLDTGNQTITWPSQKMTLSLPAGWRKEEPSPEQDPETFKLKGPAEGYGVIDVLFSRYGPVDVDKALQQHLELRQRNQSEGQHDQVSYLEIDGIKGLLEISTSNESKPLIDARWQSFRMFEGKQQFVSLSFHAFADSGVNRQKELIDILSAIRFETKD